MSKKLVFIPAFASALFFLILFSAWLSLLMLFFKAIMLVLLLVLACSALFYGWRKFKAHGNQNNNGQGD